MDLTIIVPTRNRNTSVVECVLALERNEVDIIVVDDASEEPLALLSKRARVIRHDRRRGRSASINTGLKAALHDPVLIMDDDIYAGPGMLARLTKEFAAHKHSKLGLKPRVTWDPDLPLTPTMKWMEAVHKFASPMLLSRSFVLQNGGYDENFTRRLEDTELELRLVQHGLEMRRMESAVGFQRNILKIVDLVEREFMEGISAVFLHAKFPQFMPQVDNIELLLKNEAQAADAEAAVEEIAVMEKTQSCELPASAFELYAHVSRHYFLHGIFEGLKDIGDIKPRRNSSGVTAIYRQASQLEEMGELDEARRLFRLVLHRGDEQYWDGAEYHLGCIEMGLGNSAAAYAHFSECLRLNPTHNKARRALNKPARYREVDSNVYESTEPAGTTKVLFVLFGNLAQVVNAIPIVVALRKKFDCETAWLTSPGYAALARASLMGAVHHTKSRGIIPWNWIHAHGFTHVFFPEPEANHEEWEQSGLHAIDFMAKKCAVDIEAHRSRLKPGPDAVSEAEEFLRQFGLTRKSFITASRSDGEGRHWPNSNLIAVAQQIDIPTVLFGRKGEPEIPASIACLDKPLDVIALLIGWSCFYLGLDYGVSWLATTTDTPMAIFFYPRGHDRRRGLRDVLRGEKDSIREFDIYTNVDRVLGYIESAGVRLGHPYPADVPRLSNVRVSDDYSEKPSRVQ